MQSSSSSQHQRRSKSTGCMSGILHLITRHHHHSRSRKRLPSERQAGCFSGKTTTTTKGDNDYPATKLMRRAEKPDTAGGAPASRTSGFPRRPSALVARLMGLDETPVDSPRSTAEKRRKLLGALEKCDDDLRALKRIIDAVQAAPAAVLLPHPTVVKEMDGRDSTIEGDQPSPVSVLDALSSPRNGVTALQPIVAVRSRNMERRAEGQKKARRADDNILFFHRVSMDELPRSVEQRKGESLIDLGFARWRMGGSGWRGRPQRSRAMVESVEEVWEDGAWEEKWEFGRVGVVLESEILGDLGPVWLGVWDHPELPPPMWDVGRNGGMPKPMFGSGLRSTRPTPCAAHPKFRNLLFLEARNPSFLHTNFYFPAQKHGWRENPVTNF